MRVAGYIRVSTNKEGQKESPENQKQMILDFITENHFDLYDLYTDVQTGTTDNREGLKKLIHDAENKEFDVIVAKELSRLGRNVELLYPKEGPDPQYANALVRWGSGPLAR
ncbi:recombinase family protein [Fredinandcohnia sp. FSL W7-1320]|uniref:recombinase family protein n=1 Tax=Fredinandcohnia sp. FSL W7-1320 TaxID=2954540 RepID=UPI0030FD76A5